jgi:hypothetical protein
MAHEPSAKGQILKTKDLETIALCPSAVKPNHKPEKQNHQCPNNFTIPLFAHAGKTAFIGFYTRISQTVVQAAMVDSCFFFAEQVDSTEKVVCFSCNT